MSTTYTATTITITPGALASSATVGRESASVTTDTAQNVNDYRITFKVVLTTGTPAAPNAVFVWVKTSDDGGTTWDGNATSSDAAITIDNPHQFPLGCVIPIGAQSLTRSGSFSLKAACGGSLPATWGIIVTNQTGIAFSSSAVTCKEEYNT